MELGANATVPAGLSRRALLLCFASTPVALLSCRVRAPAETLLPPYAADTQVNLVADSYNRVARQERDLPGVRSLAQLNRELVAGFSGRDLSLLGAALHLQARERLASVPRPIAEADVRAALARPIDVSPYGRPFLERTLVEARTRARTDIVYQRELDAVANMRPGCVNPQTGARIPWWLCVVIVIIIIIIIIILL